jgi:proliferating cell nuclear antigen
MAGFSIKKHKLSKVIDILDALVKEAVFEFDKDGVSTNVMDASNVGMSQVNIGTDEFEEYDMKNVNLGVNLNRLSDIISLADDKDSVVEIEFDESKRDFVVNVAGVSYRMTLITPESILDAKNPTLDLPASAEVNQKLISRAIKASEMVGERITVVVEDGEVCFNAAGDNDSVDIDPQEGEVEYDESFSAPDGASATYALEYLKDIERPIDNSSMVSFGFGDELPLEIEFNYGDATECRYVLAPRIQS